MHFKLKKSLFEAKLFEVLQDDVVVEEVLINFPIKNISSSFDSLEAIKKWLKETEEKLARQKAYACLAMRTYSSSGLLRKLEEKGFSANICLKLIDELKNLGLLKDEEFIHRLIEKELRSGHGPRYIEAKLRSQDLSVHQVRQIVTNEKQEETIKRLLKKIPRNQAAALQRRGFDFSAINKVLSSHNP